MKNTNNDPLYNRSFDELNEEERSKLKAITRPSQIKSIRILDEWEDDHTICFGVEINGIEFGFWWSSSEGIAAVEYFNESKRAKKTVMEMLAGFIEQGEEELARVEK